MPSYRFDHMDASESALFSKDLTAIRAQAFTVQYPELKGRLFVPKDPAPISTGAEKYEYRWYAETGQARIVRDYAGDSPRADIVGSSAAAYIVGIRDSYGYSIQEARAAQMAGLPLDARKAIAARNVIEKKLDDIIWDGYADVGLAGFAGLASVCSYTTPVGDAGQKGWGYKTPDEIMIDLNGMVSQIHSDSSDVEDPDTLILPSTCYDNISTKRMGDGSDQTILRHFLAVNGSVTSVQKTSKLETKGAGSSKRAICYRRSAEKVSLLVPQEFEQFAPQQRGMEVLTECHLRTGGVIAYFPKSVCYADYL